MGIVSLHTLKGGRRSGCLTKGLVDLAKHVVVGIVLSYIRRGQPLKGNFFLTNVQDSEPSGLLVNERGSPNSLSRCGSLGELLMSQEEVRLGGAHLSSDLTRAPLLVKGGERYGNPGGESKEGIGEESKISGEDRSFSGDSRVFLRECLISSVKERNLDAEEELVLDSPPAENKRGGSVGQFQRIDGRKIRVVSWNCRSLKIEKLREVLLLEPDIIALQEIWDPSEALLDLLSTMEVHTLKRDQGRGGGTLLAWKKGLCSVTRLPIKVNDDTQLVKVSLAGNRSLWLGSVYVSKGTKKEIMEIFGAVKESVPDCDWKNLMLLGDWNVDVSDGQNGVTQALQAICKQMKLRVVPPGTPTRGDSTIDYLICGIGVESFGVDVVGTDRSDHSLVITELMVPKPIQTRNLVLLDKGKAERMTLKALDRAYNAASFLGSMGVQMRACKFDFSKVLKPKPVKSVLLDEILKIKDEDSDLRFIVDSYWSKLNIENEDMRYGSSLQIKEAFKFLKRVYKYSLKRDGGIISQVMTEDGDVISDTALVNKELIKTLKGLQYSRDQPEYLEPLPFPELPNLTVAECRSIFSSFSTGKAVALDGISDEMFGKQCIDKSSRIMRDVWSFKFEESMENDIHFHGKIVALNKVFPGIPTRFEMRPICVNSVPVKILESRLSDKLKSYAVNRMHRGQTGFVPGIGIMVNHLRLMEQVQTRTKGGKVLYGLFIDFSNAYNTVLHSKLFERLRGILSEEEIELIKAIYSRQKLVIGKESFTPNIGVSQGSIISPFLFDIYIEDLYKELEAKCYTGWKDLMGYADDLLVLCSSRKQLEDAIKCIEEWGKENNLALNPRKSGILEFKSRHAKAGGLVVGSEVLGIPVVSEYKYLGFVVTGKLGLETHLKTIETRANWIFVKLWHVLRNASLTYRINLWTLLIRPLFEIMIIPYALEPADSNKSKVKTLFRKVFKRFTFLKKNVRDSIVSQLTGVDLDRRAAEMLRITDNKWRDRIGLPSNGQVAVNWPREKRKCMKILPREVQVFVNSQTRRCKDHGIPCQSDHLRSGHGVIVPNFEGLLRVLELQYRNGAFKKLDRRRKLEWLARVCTGFMNRMKPVESS
jgi:hypothetical protein